jgi:hypothetical protein
MGRRIIRTQLQGNNSDENNKNSYVNELFTNLFKYIPVEIISAWIAIKGMIKGANPVNTENTHVLTTNNLFLLWSLFVIFTGLTAFYIYKQISKEITSSDKLKEDDYIQIIISTIAFVVWVFATEEPFSSLSFYQPIYGSIILILFNLIVPLIYTKK